MKSITLYLHVHQPHRIRDYSVFDTAHSHDYFAPSRDEEWLNNERILKKVAHKSYLPMNALLLELLHKHPEFRLSLSVTGTFIEQCERWAPEILESFRRLTETGRVDIVAETYYHSLAFFYSRAEFERQVEMHRDKIQAVFGQQPTVFRNTEFAYNNDLAAWAEKAGYEGILAEGWDPYLGWRSPNYVYRPSGTEKIALLLKNYRLSDDIAFRFNDHTWASYPLSAESYVEWCKTGQPHEQIVNLFMDYETFGEHQWAESGIFDFVKAFVGRWIDHGGGFMTTTEAIRAFPPQDAIDMPLTVTWADSERDLSAWLGNRMQQEALHYLYELEDKILHTNDLQLIADWRALQTSDHVYYMCTKWFRDGDVHAYFSPYKSPYDAFIFFMNALRDVRWRLIMHARGVEG